MPEGLASKRPHSRKLRPQTVVLWLLSLAVLILLGVSVREQQKTDALSMALATYRQDSERQITELHQAQTASLEQGLLRLDELSARLQKSEQEEQQEAASLTNRMRSELSRTVEQRHQEMISAISDLRADLRASASMRPNRNSDAEKPHDVVPRPAATLISANSTAVEQTPPAPNAITQGEPHEDQPAAGSSKRKSFWGKLNPFSRKKKPQDGSADDIAQ